MNFVTAVRTCFTKYADFRDYATRPEFWWFSLFLFLVGLVLRIIGISFLLVIWDLAIIVPSIAVTVRRHHDAGRSGWWYFTFLIPPWAIILLCYPSKFTDNRYVPGRTEAGRYSVTEASATSGAGSCSVCGKMRLPGQSFCNGCGTKFPDAN